ncbi:leucyl aminopeptidase [archaeon]|nr:leucyl aminopeptidase [archaeon]|tara:strand:+ start:3798 stop:4730 length:933 start_codon:yes stop_codon:yes gene_type:complete
MDIKKPSRVLVNNCLKIKKNESVLIVTDKKRKKIGGAILEEVKKVTSNVKIIETPVAKENGNEPPKIIAKEMLNYDVVICPTTKSLSHTKARLNATKQGARIVTLPGITNEIMQIIDVDYNKIKKITLKLKKILDKSNKIHILTKIGTDVTFLNKKRKWIPDLGFVHRAGESGNLPAGEIFIAPKETNGILVLDNSKHNQKNFAPSKTKLIIKKNKVIYISNSNSKLGKVFKTIKNATNIAELGIGTNYKAKIIGSTLQDEKSISTIHIAFGNSSGIGGNVYSKIHKDIIFQKPTILVDDKVIMKEGKFT